MIHIHEACRITHQQLIAGICPWCKQYIHGNNIVSSISAIKKRTVDWDIDFLMSGLDNPELKNRVTTVNNVILSSNSRFVGRYLPFYEKALDNDSYYIRWHLTMMLSHVGLSLTLPDAFRIEELLTDNQKLLSARTVLLSYHHRHRHRHYSLSSRRSYEQNLLWIIGNRPDSPIFGSGVAQIDSRNNTTLHQIAKRIWLEHLHNHGNDLTICYHAARFFMLSEKNLSEKLLKICREVDPSNPLWDQTLGRLYNLNTIRYSGINQEHGAEKALAAYQAALQNTDSNMQRADLLIRIANISITCSDFHTASAAASEAIQLELPPQVASFRSVIIHRANNILGLIALASGDVDTAKDYLRRSVVSLGPLPSSYYPYIRLARELLGKGERVAVLAFLQECARLWALENHQLENWIYALKQGETPDLKFPGMID